MVRRSWGVAGLLSLGLVVACGSSDDTTGGTSGSVDAGADADATAPVVDAGADAGDTGVDATVTTDASDAGGADVADAGHGDSGGDSGTKGSPIIDAGVDAVSDAGAISDGSSSYVPVDAAFPGDGSCNVVQSDASYFTQLNYVAASVTPAGGTLAAGAYYLSSDLSGNYATCLAPETISLTPSEQHQTVWIVTPISSTSGFILESETTSNNSFAGGYAYTTLGTTIYLTLVCPESSLPDGASLPVVPYPYTATSSEFHIFGTDQAVGADGGACPYVVDSVYVAE
jgi:hypothetical protein